MLKPKQAISDAALVFGFWWIVLLIWMGVWPNPYRTAMVVGMMALGLIAGGMWAVWRTMDERDKKSERLITGPVRGVSCSIGDVPIHLAAPPASPSTPTTLDILPPESRQQGSEQNFALDWLTKAKASGHAAHAALFESVLRIFWAPQHKTLPATHADDPRHNHGGRTLITHSLLVCHLMLKEAPKYEYKPARRNGVQLVALRDPNYKFNPEDPLIAVLGLAHDIGKIECFVSDTTGRIVDCKKNHDLVGARIMARLDEYWLEGISPEDREILQLVIGHYHHPQAVPAEGPGRVLSDRLHALLELLIICDRMASAIENGTNPQTARLQVETESQSTLPAERMLNLGEAILQVLVESGRVNGVNNNINLGIKYKLPQYNRPLVVLKEDDFAAAVAERAGLTHLLEEKSGNMNFVSGMARHILLWLDEQDMLFREHESTPRSAVSSLYKVEFYPPKSYFSDDERTTPLSTADLPDPRFFWGSCILLDASSPKLAHLAGLRDHVVVPHISHSRMGRQGVTRGKSMAEAQLERELGIENADQEIDASAILAAAKVLEAAKQPKKTSPLPTATAATSNDGLTLEALQVLVKSIKHSAAMPTPPFQAVARPGKLLCYDMAPWLATQPRAPTQLQIQNSAQEDRVAAGIMEIHPQYTLKEGREVFVLVLAE